MHAIKSMYFLSQTQMAQVCEGFFKTRSLARGNEGRKDFYQKEKQKEGWGEMQLQEETLLWQIASDFVRFSPSKLGASCAAFMKGFLTILNRLIPNAM